MFWFDLTKVEIDGRDSMFKYLNKFGERLIQQDNYAKEDIKTSLHHLQGLKEHINSVWKERKELLAQCLDLQVTNH